MKARNYRVHKCFLVGNVIDIPVWAIEHMSAQEIEARLIKQAQKAAVHSLMRSGVQKNEIVLLLKKLGKKLSPKMLDGVHASLTKCGVSIA